MTICYVDDTVRRHARPVMHWLLANACVSSCLKQLSHLAGVALASCTDVCIRTARRHTLPGTHRRTCGVRTSHFSSLACDPQTARTWIQSIALFGLPFNRRSINIDDSRQSTSWSRQSSLSGANCCSVPSMAPLVSGVTGLSRSSRNKANKLNIWCKNRSMWVTLDINWDNKHVVRCC